jgi:hypothetical protein
VHGNTVVESKGSALHFDFQNIGFHCAGNIIVDPSDAISTSVNCVLIESDDNRGYIGGNTYKFENAALATNVATNSVRINAALTGLDLDFGNSSFQGVDATHLTFLALTTSGVRYSGLSQQWGVASVAVANTGVDGIVDVVFPKRMPYIPNVSLALNYPFNAGGKFPILGVDLGLAVSATGFRVYAIPADGTIWTATGNISFNWEAK